jgi:hypothetical protein
MVAIPVFDDVRATPLATARRKWRTLALLLFVGMLSLAAVSDTASDDQSKRRRERCSNSLDFSQPCNSQYLPIIM